MKNLIDKTIHFKYNTLIKFKTKERKKYEGGIYNVYIQQSYSSSTTTKKY